MKPTAATGHERLARAFAEWTGRHFPDPWLERAAEALMLAESQGHVGLDLGDPPAELRSRLAGLAPEALAAAIQRHQAPFVLDAGVLYTRLRWTEEGALARAWATRHAEPPANADLEQILEYSQVAVLTGPAGSGKTTRVHGLLHTLLHRDPRLRVALAAPTGKAAARLAESLAEQNARRPLPVALPVPSTVHRLLGIDAFDGRPRYDALEPLPFELLIVDEASMLSQRLLLHLLEALANTARLLLVGDAEQLPAVEAGRVLADLATEEASPGAVLRLSQRHRQQGVLASLADAVRNGDYPATRTALASATCTWRETPTSSALDAALRPWLDTLAAAMSEPELPMALTVQRQHRLLTALADGPFGAGGINRRLAARWPQLLPRPILVLRNAPTLELWNGDTGLLHRGRAWFATPEGVRDHEPALLPAWTDAFALTVHKAQGSEYEHVVVILPPEDHPLLCREWLYTAVTRARRSIEVWGTEAALRAALARRHERHSRLAVRIAHARAQARSEPG